MYEIIWYIIGCGFFAGFVVWTLELYELFMNRDKNE